MRYLVTTLHTYEPFLTEWFDCENNFDVELGMVVYDLHNAMYTKDGKTWADIKIDSL